MRKPLSPVHRIVVAFPLMLGLLLFWVHPSAAQQAMQPASSLPDLRVPRLAFGSRCFGFLPCTDIDPFGIRLRLPVLVVFRPERDHASDLYAARLHIAPSVTLFQIGEIGVVLPITLYKKDVGVTPVYEPIQAFGRLRLPLEEILGGVATTLAVAVHIASGPFVGGLPPPPTQTPTASSPMPNLMQAAIQAYVESTRYEFLLAATKRVGALTATASVGALVGEQYVEVSVGAELAYHWNILHPFIQVQGVFVPKCSMQEAALNLCERGFRFGTGVRFDWDIGAGGLMVGTGSGASEPGMMVGGQMGLDYNEKVRRMHGTGEEAVEAWWARHEGALGRWWAAWKNAAAVWPEDQVAQHVGPHRPGPFTGLLDSPPPPSSPWEDALLNDEDPESPEAPDAAATPPGPGQPPAAAGAPGAKAAGPKRPPKKHAAPSHRYAGLRQAIAAGQRAGVPPPVSGFQIHGGDDLMSDRELEWELWRQERERLIQEEEQKRRNASRLPPFEKTALNWLATAPARAVLGLLARSGPGRRAEAEEQMRQLRPLKCTPEEEEGCEAGEAMWDMIATTMVPAALETAAARQAALALVRDGAWAAAHPGEFAAAERQILQVGVEEGAGAVEQSGPRFTSVLDRLPPRLNPANYQLCGAGCGGGGIEFKPPTPPAPSTAIAEGEGGIEAAYDVAKAGGKHSRFYETYAAKSEAELKRGVRSLEKQIQEHLDKIRNPEEHIPDFRQLDPRQQRSLVEKKWPSDIERQQEQKEILEGILRERER